MILIRCNNIEKIEKIHKAYFDIVVKRKLKKIIVDAKGNKEIIKFIKNYFFINNQINESLLNDICFGNKEKLEEIIRSYKKKSGKSKLRDCLIKIEDYESYLKDGKSKEVDRLNEWDKVIKEIEKILYTNSSDEFYIKENNLIQVIENEKKKVLNYVLPKSEGEENYNFKFTNKKSIQTYIRQFKKDFNESTNLMSEIQKIFDYEEFSNYEKEIKLNDKSIKWNRHNLISMMGLTVCPYCNRQFISCYVENDRVKTTADLDHYYSQNEYPFLALSLYNFIPSCQICNSRFKLAKDFYKDSYIYPYTEQFGEIAKFKTDFYNDGDKKRKENKEIIGENDRYDIDYLLGNSNNFKIEIGIECSDIEMKNKIQNSINTFHLEDLYNSHKDYVREIIKKTIIYNESRIDELYNQYPELFSSRDEVILMVISNYICDEDLGKRPLAKLTKDICEEFGLK